MKWTKKRLKKSRKFWMKQAKRNAKALLFLMKNPPSLVFKSDLDLDAANVHIADLRVTLFLVIEALRKTENPPEALIENAVEMIKK